MACVVASTSGCAAILGASSPMLEVSVAGPADALVTIQGPGEADIAQRVPRAVHRVSTTEPTVLVATARGCEPVIKVVHVAPNWLYWGNLLPMLVYLVPRTGGFDPFPIQMLASVVAMSATTVDLMTGNATKLATQKVHFDLRPLPATSGVTP